MRSFAARRCGSTDSADAGRRAATRAWYSSPPPCPARARRRTMAEGRGEPTGEAMGEVTGYPNGTFNWVDLGTPDVAGAKAFYSHLFGWTLVDVPAGGSRTYTVAQLQDMDVAAIHQHAEGEGEGKGAEWGSSISVDHVDRTASKARNLGATVLREPEDVMDAGAWRWFGIPPAPWCRCGSRERT